MRSTSVTGLLSGTLVLLGALVPATTVGNGVTKHDAPPPLTQQMEILRVEITGLRTHLPSFASEFDPYSIPDVASSFVTRRAGSEVADRSADTHSPEVRSDGRACGNPVVVSNGNKIESETDFAAANVFGLSLTRTYNAKTTDYGSAHGLFGPRWFSNLDQRLLPNWTEPGGVDGQPGLIQLLRADGSLRSFQRAADGKWYVSGASARRERIERAADGLSYTFLRADGWKETYSYGGSVLSIANEHGAT